MSTFYEIARDYYVYLTEFNMVSVFFRVCLALLVGGLIGSERGRHGRAAGVRTHTLVCLGASMTVMIGLYAVTVLGMNGDPLRVSAQVISGIGFLGAGTILTKHHSQITGLTTAAGLWTTASLGLAIGLGFYNGALIGFVAMEIAMIMFSRQERLKHTLEFYLELNSVLKINEFADRFSADNISIQVLQARSGIPSHVGIHVGISTAEETKVFLKQFREIDYVVIAMPVK